MARDLVVEGGVEDEDGFNRFGVLGKTICRLEHPNGFNGVLVEKIECCW